MAGTRVVNKSEFDLFVVKSVNHLLPEETVVFTPEEDIRIVEGLLDMEPGSLQPNHSMTFIKGFEQCGCGRKFSWLDIINTALLTHPPAMMRNALSGNMGYIIAETVPAIFCSCCNEKLKQLRAYSC